MNELIYLALLLISFGLVLAVYKFEKVGGLYTLMVFFYILANITVLVPVKVFATATSLSGAFYGSMFLITDILNEYHGKKTARRAILLGFLSQVSFTVIMTIFLLVIPAEGRGVAAHEKLSGLFSILPRITIGSLIAYLVSINLNSWLFEKFQKIFKPLWFRNNASTIISQFVDTFVFFNIAFVGVLAYGEIWQIVISLYLLKVFVALFDTPIIYWVKKFVPQGEKEVVKNT